jgi:hypothetical protein
LRPVLLEVALLASLYLLYRFGRLLSADRVDQAFDNTRAVYRLQQWVWLPDEAVLQAWLMAWPELIKLFNQYYVAVLPGDAGLPRVGIPAPAAGRVPGGLGRCWSA